MGPAGSGDHLAWPSRIKVKPSRVDDVIEVVGDEVVPSLSGAPGFRAALLFTDPASGRMISETIASRDPIRTSDVAPHRKQESGNEANKRA